MNNLQLQFLMMIFAGWVNRSQQDVIEYLQAENRVPREQLGDGRLLFSDAQRSRLAARAKAIGRKGLFEIYSNDRKLFEVEDETFAEAGRIGLWTKADSVTYFDDLTVVRLDHRAQ